MRGNGRRVFVNGEGPSKSVLDLDAFSLPEVVVMFDPDRDDPLLRPWRRSCSAAIRKATGR